MKRTDVVIVGGGQAGLAMSRCLSDRGIDHVVLERGRVAERWRSERWDSLRLLTPNWLSRLPGYTYSGPEPDGFMRAGELADHLARYARAIDAPVETETTVRSLRSTGAGYRAVTDQGEYTTRAVVIASGANARARVPGFAAELSPAVHQLAAAHYKHPEQLPPGGVLVVGASATGVQLADEIHRSGRPVTLSVGRHLRIPRRYRGRDIMWWLETMGVLGRRADQIRDPAAARREPSFQLIGGRDGASLDLPALRARGIELCGRVRTIRGNRVELFDDLAVTAAYADEKLTRLLDRIDAFAVAGGLARGLDAPERPRGFAPGPARTRLSLREAGIRSVLWATGYCESYPWLHVPVLERNGALRHTGGITEAAGLYALGLRLLRTRKSSFIDGVGDDARALAEHLHRFLDARAHAAA